MFVYISKDFLGFDWLFYWRIFVYIVELMVNCNGLLFYIKRENNKENMIWIVGIRKNESFDGMESEVFLFYKNYELYLFIGSR